MTGRPQPIDPSNSKTLHTDLATKVAFDKSRPKIGELTNPSSAHRNHDHAQSGLAGSNRGRRKLRK